MQTHRIEFRHVEWFRVRTNEKRLHTHTRLLIPAYIPTRRTQDPRTHSLTRRFVTLSLSPSLSVYIIHSRLMYAAAREDPAELEKTFPPLNTGRVPMGDVFTSCNWVLRDGCVIPHFPFPGLVFFFWLMGCVYVCRAPKTATKRVFLITDEDNPHPGPGTKQLVTSARTTLIVRYLFF